jgi:hypothetical protein
MLTALIRNKHSNTLTKLMIHPSWIYFCSLLDNLLLLIYCSWKLSNTGRKLIQNRHIIKTEVTMKKNIMSDRVKQMAIGFSLILGLQVIFAWTLKAWFVDAADYKNLVGIPLFITVAISVGGGILMGIITEKLIRLEPSLVTDSRLRSIYFSSSPARQDSPSFNPDHIEEG